jgi:hypothetical protein
MTVLEQSSQPGNERGEDTFEERWAAWQARGRARAARTRARARKVGAILVVVLGGVGLWFLIGA